MSPKTYGECAMKNTSANEWSVKTLKMTIAPDASAHQELIKTWKKGQKWLIREAANEASISTGLNYDIFSNILGMKCM